ncbi:MAG: thioredoxin family protein [Sphingomonadaceae bacterium]|uniref:thioredoxin family protein n=1 Tax=Thermaurantiacus sp. TaxID=2820283 RepID=UPI00298F0F41|nr:thioredoxin family protein [Thermaurantiacus sp.]MCS6985961.1 thioredoxin family protein [Sphingomonadaceae bacterium]MDW8414823.1 thioredoxin family protein [Thermaurantiacus sp.]
MRTLLSSLAAVIAMTAPASAAPTIGQPAPAFTATDAQGRVHRLADFRGRTVVLEWHNPECPFVKKFYDGGAMQKLQADARAKGIVWLTINSGAPGKQGHMTAEQALAYVKAQGLASTAYIPDPTGAIGRLYDARTTPHMFVIDPQGTLVYAGAIDDTPTANPADVARARNLVTAALADVAAGRPVATPTSRPYGCSVKY